MTLSVSRQAAFLVLGAAAIISLPGRGTAQALPDAGTVLDPSSPLAPLPGFEVDWPDLAIPDAADSPAVPEPAPTPAERVDGKAAAVPVNGQGANGHSSANGAARGGTVDGDAERRYAVVIRGLDEVRGGNQGRTRFNEVSTLLDGASRPANTAQIDRRAREDARLLQEILRGEGYYAARVDTGVSEQPGGTLVVTLDVDPGERFRLDEIVLTGLDDAGPSGVAAREAFTVAPGSAADSDVIAAAVDLLEADLGRRGFPFVKVEEPELTVDHDSQSATLAVAVEPGPQARFGEILVIGRKPPFGPRHVQNIARFDPGDTYDAGDIEDLRRALISTGLVSSVVVEPVPTADPAVVDIAVTVERAPRRTIAGELGYGTGEGVRGEVSWTHRNLIRPEGAVTFRGVAGTREQYLGASLRRSNFGKRDRVLTGLAAFGHTDRNAYDARTVTLSAGIERQTNIVWQKKWTWSIGTELALSDERSTVAATGESRRRRYDVAALPGTLAYDGSDDLLNPTRGFRFAARVSPELSFRGKAFGYARSQIDGSVYLPTSRRVVLAARTRLGSIAGARRDVIAPSRRFYAGGGGSVRGYGYQDIGPRDVDNDPIGGRSIAGLAVGARIRVGDFGIVPFLDAGNIYTTALPRFTGMRYGAGLGARYYTSFGPIRVDVGTPLNPRRGDPKIAVYVSLGQAF